MNHQDSSLGSSAAYALGKIKDTQAVQALIQALNHEDSSVRGRAVYALGEIKDTQAVPALIQALNHQDSSVHWSAASALGEIGDSEILSRMWKLQLTGVDDAKNAISKIQERYKFYNHEIFHSPPVEKENITNPLMDNRSIHITTKTIMMQQPNNLNFGGASIGGVNVNSTVDGHQIGTQHNYAPEHKQNLVEAAKEIQQLLDHLSVTYPTTTESQKQAVVNQAIARIKRDNPTTWQRLRSATEAALFETFKEVLDNPFVNIMVAAVQGYRDAK